MADNPNANAAPHKEHIEVDSTFFDMLADRLTAKQMAQQKDVNTATKSLASTLGTFYKELRRSGIPRSLAAKLVSDMLILLLKR